MGNISLLYTASGQHVLSVTSSIQCVAWPARLDGMCNRSAGFHRLMSSCTLQRTGRYKPVGILFRITTIHRLAKTVPGRYVQVNKAASMQAYHQVLEVEKISFRGSLFSGMGAVRSNQLSLPRMVLGTSQDSKTKQTVTKMQWHT